MPSRPCDVNSVFVRRLSPDDPAVAPDLERLKRLRLDRLQALAALKGRASPAELKWADRRFPILAALAPVMTSVEGEITYPGDPMCLYAALCVVVDQAIGSAAQGAGLDSAFSDLCPAWGHGPTKEQRFSAVHGVRPFSPDDSNADHTIFDPRVWDAAAQAAFRTELERRRPRVFLVSTVSPGHRYALAMARMVKEVVPDCLVIFGGRHIDETMKFVPAERTVELAYSSTIRAMDDGRTPHVVDFLVSGEAYFTLALLMQAISLAMDLETQVAQVSRVVEVLDLLGRCGAKAPGNSLVCALTPQAVHAFPFLAQGFELSELPSPYRAFSVRARFPIFPSADGTPARTAHVTVSNACPYHCVFCSEAATLSSGGLRRFKKDPANAALERVCEYVSYGAEALFFDDSIFWSGSFPSILEFCQALEKARATPLAELPERCRAWIKDEGDRERLARLQWGAQLTADLVAVLHDEDQTREVLNAMRRSGCTYVYVGIESMSADVMASVHKNVRRSAEFPWKVKVRTALQRIRDAGIPVGSSVMFGLENETRATIEETVEEVGRLIDDGLLMLASPNILTYHPATRITALHEKTELLDYHSPTVENRAPYIYFEEAFPGVVSRCLTEKDIWFIHESTAKRWGSRRNSADAEEMYASTSLSA